MLLCVTGNPTAAAKSFACVLNTGGGVFFY
jgi:hypothetical protein